jgi:hypothetical protein
MDVDTRPPKENDVTISSDRPDYNRKIDERRA